MAVVYAKSVQNSGIGTSLSLIVPTGGNVAGDILALPIRVQAGIAISSVVDLLGHSWGPISPESPLSVGGDHSLYIYYIPTCFGGANTITITTSGSGLICAAMGEWSGLVTAAIDGHNAATGTRTGVGVGEPNSGNINTAAATELAIGIYTSVTGTLLTADGTPDNWSFREDAGTHKLQFYSQELSSLQVAMNLKGTLPGNDTWGAMIVTFQTGITAFTGEAADSESPMLVQPTIGIVSVW